MEVNNSDFQNTWLHFFPSDLLGKTGHFPAVIVEAHNVYLKDANGKQYIDAISGAYCVNVGYGEESIIDAAANAAKKLAYCSPFSFTNPLTLALTKKLAQMAEPVLGPNARVFFTNSGAEAVETAMKVARAYAYRQDKRRNWLISKDYAYHGVTLGALSMNGFAHMREEFGPLLPMTTQIPCIAESRNTYEELCNATPGKGHDVAGVLVEIIETSNGMTTPTPQYLDGLRRFRETTDALLIVDEVITGFGRLGTWFSAEYYDLKADILVCAKGLTSGYESLGATIVSEKIASAFAKGDSSLFAHAATFGGRPAALAAALENISIIERKQLFENAIEMTRYLESQLQKHFSQHQRVSKVTGVGLIQSLHIKDPQTKQAASKEIMAFIRDNLLQQGVITSLYAGQTDPVIDLCPPLCINKDQLSAIITAIYQALDF